MDYDSLPTFVGYNWRAMNLDDAKALVHFDQVCSQVDGSTKAGSMETWNERLADQAHAELNCVLAINSERNVIAAGWIHYSPGHDQVRAFLDGRVHPEYRNQGIGKALLNWLEARACEHLQAIADGRQQILRIMFYDRPAGAIELFKEHGFTFMYAEVEMRYNLQRPLPDYSISPNSLMETYKPENKREFYSIYKDAFLTRTDNIMSEAAWASHFTNPEDEEFRPGLSLLLKKDGHPVGYTICHVEKTGTGVFSEEPWITQMGVRRAWRRRGIASGLLVECLRQMSKAGYTNGMLSVNRNNPQASRLYERLGFKATKTFTMYAKEVNG